MKAGVALIAGLVFFYSCQPSNNEVANTKVTETIIQEPPYDTLAIEADTILLNQMLAENVARYKSEAILSEIIHNKIKDSSFLRISDSSLQMNYYLFQAMSQYKKPGYIMHPEEIPPTDKLQLQLLKNMEKENLKQKSLRLSVTHSYETIQTLKKLGHYPDQEIKRISEYFLPMFTDLFAWQKKFLEEKKYNQQ